MTGASSCGGARVADRWVRCYTRGLPQHVREERRAELASDVHEQLSRCAPAEQRWVSIAIAGRIVRGAWADIFWRIDEGRAMRDDRRTTDELTGLRALWATLTQAWFTPFALLLGLFNFAFGLGVLLDGDSTMPGRVVGPVFLFGFGAAMFTGLHLRRTARSTPTGAPRVARHAVSPRPAISLLAGALGLVVTATSVVFGMTVGGGLPMFIAMIVGITMIVAAVKSSKRGPIGAALPSSDAAAYPSRSAAVADVLIVVGTLPAFPMFWLIVPALLALVVIGGLVGTSPGTRQPAVR